jgi:tol-pal system-associated acyl-CoA thioesterase
LESDAAKGSISSRESIFECKVYYEDTDCMGVVYHANYLKYLERARWEYMDKFSSGIPHYLEHGYSPMVFKAELVFHAPARLGDVLLVRTWIESTARLRVVAKQIITRRGEPRDYLVTATITFVFTGTDGQIVEVPDEFHGLVRGH